MRPAALIFSISIVNKRLKFSWHDLAALSIPLVAAFAWYRVVPGFWWQGDDTQILIHAIDHGPWEVFVSPSAWRQLSSAHLTPWITLSFALDLSLFGMTPGPFYLHQLLSLACAALASFWLARLWVGPWTAALAITALIAGAPLVTAGFQLMNRHYIEGLAWGALALCGFVVALRRDQWRWSLLGALAYLLACTTKEIFPPLLAVLPFIPEGTPRQRLRFFTPYILVAVLYVSWRIYMLGTPVGGYGEATPLGVATLMAGLTRMRDILFGSGFWGGAAAVCLAVGLLWIIATTPRRAGLIAMVAVAAGTPLLFVAPYFDPRHLVGVWWAICLGLALGMSAAARSQRGGWAIALVILALPLAMASHGGRAAAQTAFDMANAYAAHGRFFLSGDRADVLFVHPPLAQMGHYFTGLRDVTFRLSGPRSYPIIAVDESDLAMVDLADHQVWTFDQACACLREISAEVPGTLTAWESRLAEHPLSVTIDYRDGLARWHFGPYQDGAYFLIDAGDVGKIQLSPRGVLRVSPRTLNFRIRYDAPDGWTTYSPPLEIRMISTASLTWNRT